MKNKYCPFSRCSGAFDRITTSSSTDGVMGLWRNVHVSHPWKSRLKVQQSVDKTISPSGFTEYLSNCRQNEQFDKKELVSGISSLFTWLIKKRVSRIISSDVDRLGECQTRLNHTAVIISFSTLNDCSTASCTVNQTWDSACQQPSLENTCWVTDWRAIRWDFSWNLNLDLRVFLTLSCLFTAGHMSHQGPASKPLKGKVPSS